MQLYVTVRICHTLKVSNNGITYGHKRNKNVEIMSWVKDITDGYIMYFYVLSKLYIFIEKITQHTHYTTVHTS